MFVPPDPGRLLRLELLRAAYRAGGDTDPVFIEVAILHLGTPADEVRRQADALRADARFQLPATATPAELDAEAIQVLHSVAGLIPPREVRPPQGPPPPRTEPARAPAARRQWRPAIVLAALGAVSALGACTPSPQAGADGDDPLAALTVPAESHRYTSGYWREQARTDSAGRWAQAVAYCGNGRPRPGLEADGAKPNCGAVGGAAFELAQLRAVREAGAHLDAFNAHNRALARDPRAAKAAADSWYKANKF